MSHVMLVGYKNVDFFPLKSYSGRFCSLEWTITIQIMRRPTELSIIWLNRKIKEFFKKEYEKGEEFIIEGSSWAGH